MIKLPTNVWGNLATIMCTNIMHTSRTTYRLCFQSSSSSAVIVGAAHEPCKRPPPLNRWSLCVCRVPAITNTFVAPWSFRLLLSLLWLPPGCCCGNLFFPKRNHPRHGYYTANVVLQAACPDIYFTMATWTSDRAAAAVFLWQGLRRARTQVG